MTATAMRRWNMSATISPCRRRTGRDGVKDWEYYIVFSMFRIAAILQGVYKRGLDGNAASVQALEVGAKTRPIAEQAWELARSLG